MSYQQFPPSGQGPVVQQPAAPFAGAPQQGNRRAGLIGVGALLLVAGVIAGIVMFLASSSNYDDGVRNLARAPIGCTTSLEFDEAGTYTIFVETEGEIGELRGDCPNADTDYSFDDDELPDVDVELPPGASSRRGSTDLDPAGDVDILAALKVLQAPQYTRR